MSVTASVSQSLNYLVKNWQKASVTLSLLDTRSHIKDQPKFSARNTVQPHERGQRLICKESPKLAWQIHTHSDILAPRLLDNFSDVPVEREV